MLIKNLILFSLFFVSSCNIASVITDADTKLGSEFTKKSDGIRESLLHFWKFEEGSSQTRIDSVGNLDMSDANGHVIPNTTGAFGNGVSGQSWSAGTGAALYSTANFSFNTNENLNVSFWLKNSAAITTVQYIIDCGQFRVLVNSSFEIRISFNAEGASAIFGGQISNDNTWYHYSINVDRSNNTTTLYRNGSVVGTDTVPLTNDPTSSSCAIMSDTGGTWLSNEISLDSFGIWNRSLSTSEISSLYNLSSGLD